VSGLVCDSVSPLRPYNRERVTLSLEEYFGQKTIDRIIFYFTELISRIVNCVKYFFNHTDSLSDFLHIAIFSVSKSYLIS
jgi:transcriptional regulator of heat shock response